MHGIESDDAALFTEDSLVWFQDIFIEPITMTHECFCVFVLLCCFVCCSFLSFKMNF